MQSFVRHQSSRTLGKGAKLGLEIALALVPTLGYRAYLFDGMTVVLLVILESL